MSDDFLTDMRMVPVNFGPLRGAEGSARITGPCGDTMEVWLRVADGRIAQATYTTDGCGHSIMSGAAAAMLAEGKTLDEAGLITQAAVLETLGGLPGGSQHCALLAANTLKAAVADYQARQRPKTGATGQPHRPEALHIPASQTVLVLSGKGGVGKSTIAANLAVFLANSGKRVGLLDVDLHGPSIPRLMGLEGREVAMAGGRMMPVEVRPNLKVLSIGFMLEGQAQAVIWRGPKKAGVIQQFLRDADWGELDCLVIDCPPGTGDEPLSVAQTVGPSAAAVIVTTPQELAVDDVRRSITFCRSVGLVVAGVIENMSGLECPHCHGHVGLFKEGGGEALAGQMQVPFLGRVPIDPAIVACADVGTPFVEADSERHMVAVLDRAVQCIDDLRAQQTSSVLRATPCLTTTQKEQA